MKLVDYLRRKDIEHQAFAKKVGVSKTAVSRWIRGATPHLKDALRIVEVTRGRVRLEDLVGER